jgi:hypothetical protein
MTKKSKSKYYFAVITRVSGDCEGNYACDVIYINPNGKEHVAGANIIVNPPRIPNYDDMFANSLHSDRYKDTIIDLTKEQLFTCNSPVFSLGEILIMDPSNDRSVPEGKKPDKWDVSYECFDDILEAVECSKKAFDS